MGMTKRIKAHIKEKMPYYGSIERKNRYSDPIKDKAWTLLSDYVRMRDFITYGRCVATGQRIVNWRDCDAGHFYNMGSNGALLGFDEMNIHAQNKRSNLLSSASDGAEFEREIIRRHGEDMIKYLKGLKNKTVKADDYFFLDRIKSIYFQFKELKEKHPNYDYPDYI